MNSKSALWENRQSPSLSSIIQKIIRLTDPEKILLLSPAADYRLTENLFKVNPAGELVSGPYHLLALCVSRDNNSIAAEQAKWISRTDEPANFLLNLMDIHAFNRLVLKGDIYATRILWNAMLWYDRGNIQLADPKFPF